MSAWVIDQYGTNEVLRVSDEIMMPTINLASEVLIKVEAASLNPLDISMRGKWCLHPSTLHEELLNVPQLMRNIYMFLIVKVNEENVHVSH